MARPPQQTVDLGLAGSTPPPDTSRLSAYNGSDQRADVVEQVNDDGGTPPSDDQLQAAMNALNAAADGPVDPETLEGGQPQPREPVERRLPESVSRRAEIANRAAAARMDEMIGEYGAPTAPEGQQMLDEQGNPINLNSQSLYYGQFGDPNQNFMGEQMQPAEPPAPAAQQRTPVQEPGMDETERYMVKVDGEELEVSRDELIRSYQKDAAASRRLNEATELLKQAQSAAAANLQPTATPPVGDQTPAPAAPTEVAQPEGLDDIDFAAYAEKIQLGETQEGAQALQELTQRVVQSQQAPPQMSPDQMYHAMQDRMASDQALNQFKNDYPDIVEDDQLYAYAGRHAVEAMIEDFVANGATDEMVANARANPQRAIEAHRTARLAGTFSNLRSPSQIYQQAGERTREWVNKIRGGPPPQPQAGNGQVPPQNVQPQLPPRADRARTAQQSPTLRQAPVQAPQEAPRPMTRSEKIAQMKQARGQYPAGHGVVPR